MNDITVSHDIRDKIIAIEKTFCALPGALMGDTPEYLQVSPLKHSFADGMYVREIFLPKGMFYVTKIHKKLHPYFIMRGKVEVLTEEGMVRLEAPYQGLTKPGTKRLIYVLEDTVWITVHATHETDIEKIEEEMIAKNFDEIDSIIHIKNLIEESANVG